jgi:peptidoglycan glycosyltransferase
MDKFSRNVKIVSAVIVIMFISLLVYLSMFMIKDAKSVEENSFNQRNYIQEDKIKRGDILDRNGNILATTVKQNGKNVRSYRYGRIFAHVVGYNSRRYGKTGVELQYNKELAGLDEGVGDKLAFKIAKKEETGKNVQLTLDSGIQKEAYDALGNYKGSVVALDPKTGEVLAMVSKPDFNPNSVDTDWKSLRDNIASPLYNRATQGLYPPGSTFKTITASAAYKYDSRIEQFRYTCSGVRNIEGYKLKCFNGEVHGFVGIKNAFKDSCNTAFAGIGMEVGRPNLIKMAEEFQFNKNIPFELPLNKSSVSINTNSNPDLAQASIGQGRVLASPLQMALVAATIANNGVMMRPYIEKSIYSNKLLPTGGKSSEELATPLTPEINSKITYLMESVVNSGTGTAAHIDGVRVAGKTGTAETNDVTHAWFIAFAPVDNPKIAVAVILDGANNSGGAVAAGY